MEEFRITRDLKPSDFSEHEVWSEYYDFDELEELRSWGVAEHQINELLSIAKEGSGHPYYPIPRSVSLPDRMRVYILSKFITANGDELRGIIINPNPFVFGIFCGNGIVMFSQNLKDFWSKSEEKVRSSYNTGQSPIFPLQYSAIKPDSEGNQIMGVFGEPNA
ncbi:hypothetical protein [uncultured Pseudoteredinibacter sp.]|uniref:hypothetical protein n=1 Tax=uncultured Pseudoteredinibacter sp. TaxID=1641701 RepID=UPI00262C182F|nr:hypothetical protein [uncultured Pseudoteredinibacter sp.]